MTSHSDSTSEPKSDLDQEPFFITLALLCKYRIYNENNSDDKISFNMVLILLITSDHSKTKQLSFNG